MFLASDHPYTSNWHRFRHFASPILEPDKLPAFRQIKPIFYVILPFFEPLIKRGMFGICSKIAEKGIFVSDSEVSKMPKIPFLVVLVICIYIFGCFMPRVFFEGPSRPSSGILLAAITWGGAVPGTYTAGYLPRPLRITFTSDSTLGAGDTVTIVPHTQLRAWAICLCEPVGGWVGESGMLLCLCACGGTRVRAANRRASPS